MDANTRGVSAIVEYDYTAKESDELDLVKGAIIHSIKQMPGGWWEGTLQSNGKTGMFPDNFVRIVDSSNDENTVTLREKSATSNRRCKVIYSYTQVNDDELSLAVGDVIEFLGEVEEGWWRGRLKNKIGVFPSNFVVAIEPSPILASKRPPTVAIVAPTATATAPLPTTKTATTTTTTNKSAASAGAAAAASSLSAKKTNRLSFHNSKEDLLSSGGGGSGSGNMQSTTTTTSSSLSSSSATTTAAATAATIAAAAATNDAAPLLPPKPQRDYCRVEFPYAPQNDDELELKVGDIITIISMELPDKGWWKGELRGKVGVFPDNFVKLLAASEVSPLNDTQQSAHRTAKNTNAGHNITAAAANSTANSHLITSSSSSTTATNSTTLISNNSATTSKVFIKKSGSSSSTQSSNRKDSFGSRDSLNDIMSETGLPSGNVAAQRKSLENKNLDLSNPPDSNARLGLKKQQTHTNSNNTNTTTVMSSSNSSTSELRKSLESMDDKTKTPPPVLTKKPTVPSKKSSSVSSVAGNIFSGLKQKVKNVENKLTTTASQDYADGVGSSKMSPGGLPESGSSGNVVMRRAATIAVEDSDFDKVERSSILQDVRQGRVKAPKRRPPSAAINVIGESNNNNSIYLNGSNGGSAELLPSEDNNSSSSKPHSSDDNSTGEEPQLAKPKPREWEKKKAPWMEELKASQVKKKTSPNVEPRTTAEARSNNVSSTISSSSSASSTTTKVQSSAVTSSSLMQQSMTVESSQQLLRKEHNSIITTTTTNSSSSIENNMSKSLSGKLISDNVPLDDVRKRPNSLSIRNRSISPSLNAGNGVSAATRTAAANTSSTAAAAAAATTEPTSSTINSTAAKTATLSSTVVTNHYENNIPASATAATSTSTSGKSESTARVTELEKRIEKLETIVLTQQRTIDDLVRTLREETDQVKVLRGELDKYAQCVTQV